MGYTRDRLRSFLTNINESVTLVLDKQYKKGDGFMAKRKKGKLTNKRKWLIGSLSALALVAIAGGLWLQQKNSSKNEVTSYKSVNVIEGNVASSIILSGRLKANQEQYVYFDASKGTDAKVTVNVGDQVTAGQQLVQYDTTTAQASYDTAVRNLNKIGRQITYLKTYGNLPTTTTSTDEETGQETSVTTPPTAQANASYNQQLQDLNDTYANAQTEVDKAQQALNATVIVSDVSGTVVETNTSIDPSSKTSQTLVHVATEGQLQVQGTLGEYDLANVKVGQEVKIKSKVYPDQEWTGKIAYISNYPETNTSGSSESSSSSPTYKYKIDFTSPLNDLKQGFTVSVEVQATEKHALVPTTAVQKKNGKRFVWVYDDSTGKITKTEVSLGQADAKSQEILTGLNVGQIVISNPDKSFKNGDKLDNVSSDDTTK